MSLECKKCGNMSWHCNCEEEEREKVAKKALTYKCPDERLEEFRYPGAHGRYNADSDDN